MRNARASVCLILCAVLGTTGCASIVGKSQYPVQINSQPDQADITVVDEDGSTVFSGRTPTTVTLRAKAGYFKGKNYTVTFQKEGYAPHVAEIRRGVSGWYIFGNLVLGGVVGWLIVDPATGAMWTLQEEVSADLTPLQAEVGSTPTSAVAAGEDGGLRIVLWNDVPPDLRSELVSIR